MYNPIEDMANPPSEMSMKLAEIMLEQKQAVMKNYRPRLFGLLDRQKELRQRYDTTLGMLENFQPAKETDALLGQFSEIAGRMVECEILMAYSSEGNHDVFTIDDRRKLLLRDFSRRKADIRSVISEFGYYAERPMEIDCPRYSELDRRKLLEIANRHRDFSSNKATNTDFARYTATREELRYRLAMIVAVLRTVSPE